MICDLVIYDFCDVFNYKKLIFWVLVLSIRQLTSYKIKFNHLSNQITMDSLSDRNYTREELNVR